MEPTKFALKTFVIGGAALYGCQQLLKNPEIDPSLNLVKTALEGSPGPLKNALLSTSISLNPRNLPSALAQVPAVIFQWAILPTLVKTASFSNAYFPVLTAPILIAIINAPITYATLSIATFSPKDITSSLKIAWIFLIAITPFASYHLANKVPSFSMGKWNAALCSLNTTVIGYMLGSFGLQNLVNKKYRSPLNIALATLASSLGMLAAGLLTAKGLWQAKELVKTHGSLLSAPLLAGLATGIGAPLSKKALTLINPKAPLFYHGKMNRTSEVFDAIIRILFVSATAFLFTSLFISRLTHRISGYTLSYPKIFSLSALAAISSFYNFATVQKEMGWKSRTYNNPSPIKPEHFAEILEQIQQVNYAGAFVTFANHHPNFDEPLVADLLLQLGAIDLTYLSGLLLHLKNTQFKIQNKTLSPIVLNAHLETQNFDFPNVELSDDCQLKEILKQDPINGRYDAKTISFLLRKTLTRNSNLSEVIGKVDKEQLVDYNRRKITSEDVGFHYFNFNVCFKEIVTSSIESGNVQYDKSLSAPLSYLPFGDIKGFFQDYIEGQKLTLTDQNGHAHNYNAIRVLAHLDNLKTRYFLFKELPFTQEYLNMTGDTSAALLAALIEKLQAEKVCDAQVLAMVIEQFSAEKQANLLNALETTNPPVNDLYERPITKEEVEKAMWKPQPFPTPLTKKDLSVATESALWAGAMVAGIVAACILIPPAARFAWENKGAPLSLLTWSWSSTNKPLLASTIAATAGFALSNTFRSKKSNLNYVFAILAGAFVSPLIARKAFGHQMARWEGAAFAALGALQQF
ncbi:MAG: hypothetical protein KDK71_03380 [Chlamydiia bacterium]|nr:hypothetical protein [Chlamydiia bacterium]